MCFLDFPFLSSPLHLTKPSEVGYADFLYLTDEITGIKAIDTI